jgi:hypothetical protein
MKIVIVNHSTGERTNFFRTDCLPRIGDTIGNLPVDDYGNHPEVRGVLLFPSARAAVELIGEEGAGHEMLDAIIICEDVSE